MSREAEAGTGPRGEGPAVAPAGAERWRREIDMMSAVFGLTRAGERPVEITRLAAAIGRDREETLALARYFGLRMQGELVHYDPDAGPTARFRLHINGRTVDVGGCAIDVIWMASAIDVPLDAEATCPTTGAPIHVHLTPDGVERLEPSTTVVAGLDPERAPQLQGPGVASPEEIERDVCSQILFLTSPEAASDWLDRRGGGRIFQVGDLFEEWRSLSSNVDVA